MYLGRFSKHLSLTREDRGIGIDAVRRRLAALTATRSASAVTVSDQILSGMIDSSGSLRPDTQRSQVRLTPKIYTQC